MKKYVNGLKQARNRPTPSSLVGEYAVGAFRALRRSGGLASPRAARWRGQFALAPGLPRAVLVEETLEGAREAGQAADGLRRAVRAWPPRIQAYTR